MGAGHPPRIDPRLLRRLRAAGAGRRAIEAVICLEAAGSPALAARRLVRKVEEQTGEAPQALTVFANLGSFLVAGSPSFLAALLRQPGIASATINAAE